MPFPLALGGKHVSTKPQEEEHVENEHEHEHEPLALSPLDEDDVHGVPLRAVFCASQTALATSTVLSATFSIRLFHMINTSTCTNANANANSGGDAQTVEKMVACIRVQISPVAQAFSARYRDSIYRIDMSPILQTYSTSHQPLQSLCIPPPTAIFCRKFLVLVVASQVIIFQLRKPLSSFNHAAARATTSSSPLLPPPPLPSYVTPKIIPNIIIPVATNPRRVAQLANVLSVCNMETTEHPLLLAGLENGAIVVISYKDSLVAGTLVTTQAPVTYLAHISMGKRGRLVALLGHKNGHAAAAPNTNANTTASTSAHDGTLTLFESHALIGTQEETEPCTDGVVPTEYDDEQQDEPGSLNNDDEDDNNNHYRDESQSRRSHQQGMEMIRLPSKRSTMVLVQLTPLLHTFPGTFCAATWIDASFLVLLCTPPNSSKTNNNVNSNNCVAQVVVVLEQEISPVTSLSMSKERLAEIAHGHFNAAPSESVPYSMIHHGDCILLSSYLKEQFFCCCWHWRSNTTSLVLSSAQSTSPQTTTSPSCCLSRLLIGTSLQGISQFIHIVYNGSESMSSSSWKKVLYSVTVVSPHTTLHATPTTVREEQPLLMSSSSVTFPISKQTCALHQYELDWRSASIPSSYLTSCGGVARIGCISRASCRSIAVASSLGLCMLNTTPTSTNRWKRFDRIEESAFSVLAMDFWESATKETDLLLTVIEISNQERYLACWYRKRLDLNHQLLHHLDGTTNRWGIQLPAGFTPNALSLLSNDAGKAVVMITECGSDPSVVIFQLQLSFTEGNEFIVKCSLALHGGFSPDINDIFLASASFYFDLEQNCEEATLDHHVAVVGMIGPDKFRAVIATRWALLGEVDVVVGTMTKRMLSDILDGNFVWMFEFSNGSIWCWITPSMASQSTPSTSLKLSMIPPMLIGEGDHAFRYGTISRAGDAAMWMLGSTDTQSQFAVGCVPSSRFGCIMKIGQSSTKHHRLIPGDASQTLDHEVFSISRTSLMTPAYLVSLINHLMTPPSDDASLNQAMDVANKHYLNYLQPSECGDTAFVTLRLLVLRAVETVTSLKKKQDAFKIAKEFFSRVITFLANALSPNAFACLLLSLARQVEPSCMEHLFPLPSNPTAFVTIEDLYIETVRHGSLGAPTASLPLLSTKLSALEECKEILYHCLLNLSFSILDTEQGFDTTREERRFVRDLFRFANQLEQMDEAEFWSDSKQDIANMPTVEEKKQGKVLTTPTKTSPKKSSYGFSILTPLICSGRRRRQERAVYEAASTFIGSGFEEFEYSQIDVSTADRVGPVSVMFMTGKLLVRLGLESKHGWKRAAVMSRLILGDTVIDESGKGVIDWVQRMSLTQLAVAAHKLSGSKDQYLDLTDSDELADVITNYLAQGMFAANREMTRSDAAWLLELVILSLSRLSSSQAINQSLAPDLVLMTTIVGHVSGRMEDMFQMKNKDKNPLMMCYDEAKRSLDRE